MTRTVQIRPGAWLLGLLCLTSFASVWAEGVAVDLPAPPVGQAQAGPQWIRVAVVQNQPQVDLTVQGRFKILAPQSSSPLREGSRLGKVAVRGTAQGIQVGQDLFPLGGVWVEPARDAAIHVNGQRLRGTIEIIRQHDLTLLVVNHVDLEDYLRSVVSKEAPPYWPSEALKALAIAARTYALFQRVSKTAVPFDVSADVLSQVYGGKTAERGRPSRAVRETKGLVLTYHGQVFPAFYHSTCGGRTENGSAMGPFDLPPLRGGISCSYCAASPFYRWERRLTKADLAWAVKAHGYGSIWPVEDMQVAERTPNGRVTKVFMRGGSRSLFMSGQDFRAMLGFERLRSTAFAIGRDGDDFILRGYGWGHGVGLCQWGAAHLAQQGLLAKEILAFYYPDAELARLGEITVQPIMVLGR